MLKHLIKTTGLLFLPIMVSLFVLSACDKSSENNAGATMDDLVFRDGKSIQFNVYQNDTLDSVIEISSAIISTFNHNDIVQLTKFSYDSNGISNKVTENVTYLIKQTTGWHEITSSSNISSAPFFQLSLPIGGVVNGAFGILGSDRLQLQVTKIKTLIRQQEDADRFISETGRSYNCYVAENEDGSVQYFFNEDLFIVEAHDNRFLDIKLKLRLDNWTN
ncbi:hypothetical protein DID77_01205 [Candidatus Marinamargulisbacteria bacterium SCGC AG-439-L15]|nr:hypothetical protein DID77_01205 [Candidatus Marinamargulisbacteria bacterium SCGC AG-439-L15]